MGKWDCQHWGKCFSGIGDCQSRESCCQRRGSCCLGRGGCQNRGCGWGCLQRGLLVTCKALELQMHPTPMPPSGAPDPFPLTPPLTLVAFEGLSDENRKAPKESTLRPLNDPGTQQIGRGDHRYFADGFCPFT